MSSGPSSVVGIRRQHHESSLGHASHYLAGLGLALKGEVLESAVKGDTRCRFVFYLPNNDNVVLPVLKAD